MRRTAVLADATEGYRPDARVIEKGEIVINDGLEEPGLYFKTEGQQLVKVGPCHVGKEEPNSKKVLVSKATGWRAQVGLTKGELWLQPAEDTSRTPVLKVYDGNQWLEVNTSIPKDIEEEITFNNKVVYKSGVVHLQPVYCEIECELEDNMLVTGRYVKELEKSIESLKREIEEIKRGRGRVKKEREEEVGIRAVGK